MSKDMVMFQMPDGTEVSNDPRFDLDEALTKSLNSRPTTGSVGITWDEQNAQVLSEKVASLQSGQPGVGENATVDDPTLDAHGVLGSPAQRIQKDDVKEAKELGGTPKSTAVDDPEPEDSNEKVLAVRKSLEEDRKKYAKAVDNLDEDGEGEGTDYGSWTGKQLKAEVAKRNADETRSDDDRLELKKGMKVDDVRTMLEQDDARVTASTVEDPDDDEDEADDEDDESSDDDDE